jgi:hypothetical protein
MIWFACKECGKREHRPEEAAGTLVFCACGAANRVPWESTVEAPEQPAETERVPPARPRRDEPAWDDDEEAPRRSRRAGPRPHDPDRCFNHPDVPSTRTCDDCREAFCDGCVVSLQGRTLCGPCKNFRLHARERPAAPAPLAVVALVLGLLSGPWGFCLSNAVAGAEKLGPALAVVFGGIGVGFPVAALGCGLKALWDINHHPRLAGRGFAVTGMTVAAAGLLWCLALLGLVAYHHVLGE